MESSIFSCVIWQHITTYYKFLKVLVLYIAKLIAYWCIHGWKILNLCDEVIQLSLKVFLKLLGGGGGGGGLPLHQSPTNEIG
jgi:hypothetical protein